MPDTNDKEKVPFQKPTLGYQAPFTRNPPPRLSSAKLSQLNTKLSQTLNQLIQLNQLKHKVNQLLFEQIQEGVSNHLQHVVRLNLSSIQIISLRHLGYNYALPPSVFINEDIYASCTSLLNQQDWETPSWSHHIQRLTLIQPRLLEIMTHLLLTSLTEPSK